MSNPTLPLVWLRRNDNGELYSIGVYGHGDETTCAVLSTICAYLEALLDNFNIPYTIECEPKSGTREIRTMSDNPDAKILFETAAAMFRAASICSPTRGRMEIEDKETNKEE